MARRKKLRVLVLIPCKPNDLNPKVLPSILHQTILPVMIVVLPNRGEYGKTLAEKVSHVLNSGLDCLPNLEAFDYVLRVDSDAYLPPDFIEKNVEGSPDLSGSGGCSMLIKVAPFLHCMGGRFHPEDDDSYICSCFLQHGYMVVRHKRLHVLLRSSGNTLIGYWHRGKSLYRNGYEPVHVFATLFWVGGWKNLVAIVSYFWNFVKHTKRFNTATFITHYQVRRIFRR